jgi:hypothetical protein
MGADLPTLLAFAAGLWALALTPPENGAGGAEPIL